MEEKDNNDVLEEKDNDDVSEENDNDDALPVSNVEQYWEENETIAHQFYQESNCCNILGFRGIFIFALTIVVTVFQYAILLIFS